MDFKVETLGPCRKKIVVTIPPERVGEEFDKRYGEINESVAMPGFRPGHAPRKLLERRFSTHLAEQVRDELLKAALEELLRDKQVEPLAAPEIDLSDRTVLAGEAFAFEFELLTRPEFETPVYKGIELRVPPLEVSEAEIDEAVDRVRRRGATLETAAADDKVEAGDVLVVDWRAMDGDSVEARDDNAYYPFGRGVLAGFVAEGLDAQLEGQRVGFEARADVRVAPDDPREELRARELELVVTLKQVRRYVLPPLDAAFLAKHDFDDEAELRAETRKQIMRLQLRQRDTWAEERLVQGLLQSVQIALPDTFVDREVEGWAERKRMALQMEHVEDDEISRQIDSARDDTRAAIQEDMQRHFLLDRIATLEGVDVSEAEMVQAIQGIAQMYGHPVEQVASSFRDAERLAELRSEIRSRKARGALREAATLIEDSSLSLADEAAAALERRKHKPAP